MMEAKAFPDSFPRPTTEAHSVWRTSKKLDADGKEICPNELKPADIPSEMAGRPASSQLGRCEFSLRKYGGVRTTLLVSNYEPVHN